MAGKAVLALVGGGRWARVYLSVLATMPLPFRIVVVARHGLPQMRAAVDALGCPVDILPDLDSLLAGTPPAGAIVVNAAAAHADTALRLLRARVPVLVEKPAALDVQSALHLTQVAREHSVTLQPALTYLHCSYLDNFAQLLRSRGIRPSVLRLDWADPAREARYGEQKQYDRSIGLALDLMPHAWSIVASVLGQRDPQVENCCVERGGRRVATRLRVGHLTCDLLFEREAQTRRRFLSVNGDISIDFSQEPGTVVTAGGLSSGDPDWLERADRPVRRQVEAFLRTLADPPSVQSLADLQASVSLAAECDSLVKDQQAALLAATPASRFDDDIACAVTELLSRRLLASGRLAAGDHDGLSQRLSKVREAAGRPPTEDWLQALARGAGVD